MNADELLKDQGTYFSNSYDQFLAFGGPCVYFHEQALAAAEASFLSPRHIEMIYATLTAWGMHRMGDSGTTKTKLTSWEVFSESLLANDDDLRRYRAMHFLGMPEEQYSDAILNLKPIYKSLKLSISEATIVANSKALYHVLPDFIPPIDRQFTVRFLKFSPSLWLDSSGKFKAITLPNDIDTQFDLFHQCCVELKQISDRIQPELFKREWLQHRVTSPKAIDNAIVNYVRIISKKNRATT